GPTALPACVARRPCRPAWPERRAGLRGPNAVPACVARTPCRPAWPERRGGLRGPNAVAACVARTPWRLPALAPSDPLDGLLHPAPARLRLLGLGDPLDVLAPVGEGHGLEAVEEAGGGQCLAQLGRDVNPPLRVVALHHYVYRL